MSEVTRRLATDSTVGTALEAIATAQEGTNDELSGLGTAIGDNLEALELLSKDETLQAIASILSSVKSVNGKYGVVVLDSGDILISKTAQNSKTVKTVLTELETAVDETPLAFTPSLISGTTDQYKITVTTGTPS